MSARARTEKAPELTTTLGEVGHDAPRPLFLRRQRVEVLENAAVLGHHRGHRPRLDVLDKSCPRKEKRLALKGETIYLSFFTAPELGDVARTR